jgi:hypothetical protein
MCLMTTKQQDDIDDFLGKIDWEGGVVDALEYGLTTERYPNLPQRLRDKWVELREAWNEFAPLIDEWEDAAHFYSDTE